MNRNETAELASRAGDGVEVALLWRKWDNVLTVCVTDSRTGDAFELDAHSENALEVFYHPYAYAAFRGIGYGADASICSSSAEALAA